MCPTELENILNLLSKHDVSHGQQIMNLRNLMCPSECKKYYEHKVSHGLQS